MDALNALSPLDGRYHNQLEALGAYFSEAALMKYRVQVEVEWLIFMADHDILPKQKLPPAERKALQALYQNFSLEDAQAIKSIENKTNHDVKAVEYFIKNKIVTEELSSFLHFACTSEDINNLAYALMIRSALNEVMLPQIEALVTTLNDRAHEYAAIPMLARTHGQAASPTTVGKEFANIAFRLKRQAAQLKAQEILGKFHGAVGNFNAHCVSLPDRDWPTLSQQFVTGLGLQWNPLVTQIEPHDFIAELCHTFIRVNTILLDACRDFWTTISLGYFKLKVIKDEVGSSTMPHKVNPIDFENAEGNLGLANALFNHFAEKLPISRLQRDLSDSTVLRNIGSAFAYAFLAYRSFGKGLSKITPDTAALHNDLKDRYEVLTEAVQTVLRYHGISDAYEQLKAASRGKVFDKAAYLQLVEGLSLPKEVKARLQSLRPERYVGLAETLAKL